jgi:hypothetical protein
VARVVEGGLSDSVVLWVEYELDLGSRRSNNVVGSIFKDSIGADGNLDGPVAGGSVDGSEGSKANGSG